MLVHNITALVGSVLLNFKWSKLWVEHMPVRLWRRWLICINMFRYLHTYTSYENS